MNQDIREALHNLLSVMEMQEKRQSGEFHISGETFMGMWSDAKHNAREALAALERERAGEMCVGDPQRPEACYRVRCQLGKACATPPAAEREGDEDEAYKIGYRDGYDEAVQDIDVLTGGDGEYRYCTDHDPDRHTPDAEIMKRRIEERFDALQAPADAQDAARYRWLRSRDLDTIHNGGVFAGMTPKNVVLNGDDLDAAIDKQRAGGEK